MCINPKPFKISPLNFLTIDIDWIVLLRRVTWSEVEDFDLESHLVVGCCKLSYIGKSTQGPNCGFMTTVNMWQPSSCFGDVTKALIQGRFVIDRHVVSNARLGCDLATSQQNDMAHR